MKINIPEFKMPEKIEINKKKIAIAIMVLIGLFGFFCNSATVYAALFVFACIAIIVGLGVGFIKFALEELERSNPEYFFVIMFGGVGIFCIVLGARLLGYMFGF